MPDRTNRRAAWLTTTVLGLLGLAACAPSAVDTRAQPGALVLSDANVSSIFGTANMGEVQLAQLALQRTSNDAVRGYAQRMIQDHTNANQQLERILTSARMRPVPVEPTDRLSRSVSETMATLQQLEGTAFDRAYMESQVEMHRWLLGTLDDALIPSTRRRDLEELLRNNRSIVAAHLQQAQQILASLEPS